MTTFARLALAGSAALTLLAGCSSPPPPAAATPQSKMTFFVTSRNPGQGANFGGLAGADAHCQALAASVGAGARTWRAYLSAGPADGKPHVNARERIGKGPWQNVKGDVIAANLDELHGKNNLNKQTVLSELGEGLSGRGDPVNMHDILTGTSMDGRAVSGDADTTCGNWTKGGTEGSAIVGHHDRVGLGTPEAAQSWNSSHATRGCGLEQLKSTGGNGRLYCFAVN